MSGPVNEAHAGVIGVTRAKLVAQVSEGAWTGTDDVLCAVLGESLHQHGWRPVRAGALLAAAELNQRGRIWMTPQEFATWVPIAKAMAKRKGHSTAVAQTELGMSSGRVYDLQRPDRVELRGLRISKPEALGCAHYALGLDPPIAHGDADALTAWFVPRFGRIKRVAEFLDVTEEWLGARLKGWELSRQKRVERQPEPFVIRALDWLWRVGPICPYGDRPQVDLWPEQGAPTR